MTKYDILRDIFDKIGAIFIFEEYFGVDLADTKEEEFVQLISSKQYNMYMFKGISQERIRQLVKVLFPYKPTGSSIKLDKWILAQYGYRYCRMCDTVKLITDFTFNKSKSDGLNCQCKVCQKAQTAKTQPARQAKYKAAGLRAIVPWTDLEKISIFYAECPVGYQVDHIVPLQGKNVSGLHVLDNLQYLTVFENNSKHNKFDAQ